MAGNPNYVNVTPIPSEERDDEDWYSRILVRDEVLEDAKELTKEAEMAWPGVFDHDDAPDGTTKKLIYDLCAAVEELTSPDGKMDILNDRLLDIRDSIDGLSETITEITEDYEEDEE